MLQRGGSLARHQLAQTGRDAAGIGCADPAPVPITHERGYCIARCISQMQDGTAGAQVFVALARHLHHVAVGEVDQHVGAALCRKRGAVGQEAEQADAVRMALDGLEQRVRCMHRGDVQAHPGRVQHRLQQRIG